MPSIYQDITSVAGAGPIELSIPADTGRLRAVVVRPEYKATGHNEATFGVYLADITREPPTPKALLITASVGSDNAIGWNGDIQLETNDVIWVRVWSQTTATYRIYVLTEV